MGKIKKKFSKIYDKYVEKIYRFIFLKVDSQETAEDLTSQVFVKVWERLNNQNNQKEIGNLTAYLYQIARNEIADYHRQKAKFPIIPGEGFSLADSNPNLEQLHQLREELEILRTSLAQLKEDYQNVIIWRYLENYSIKEISQLLGKTEGGVRVMLHRALKDLRKKMGNSA